MWLISAEWFIGDAHAYCRHSVCETKAAKVCVPATPSDCGVPARWSENPISYDVAATPPGAVDYAAAIARGFDQWSKVDCGDGRHPGVAIVPRVVATPETTPSRGHVIVGDQPDDPRAGKLALTTLRFSPKSGVVISARTTFYATLLKGALVDSVALHEAGHFLGLAHSNDASSVMAPEVHDGEQARTALAADDIAAVCALFPPVGGPVKPAGSPAIVAILIAAGVLAIGGAGLWWLRRRRPPAKMRR